MAGQVLRFEGFKVAVDYARHRVVLNFQAEAEGVGSDVIVEQVLKGR